MGETRGVGREALVRGVRAGQYEASAGPGHVRARLSLWAEMWGRSLRCAVMWCVWCEQRSL